MASPSARLPGLERGFEMFIILTLILTLAVVALAFHVGYNAGMADAAEAQLSAWRRVLNR